MTLKTKDEATPTLDAEAWQQIKKCPCGMRQCKRYMVGPGHFYQGTGYDYEDARLIAAAGTAAHEVWEMNGPHGRYNPIKAVQALPELIRALHEVSHHSDDEGYMVDVDRALARAAGKEGTGDD